MALGSLAAALEAVCRGSMLEEWSRGSRVVALVCDEMDEAVLIGVSVVQMSSNIFIYSALSQNFRTELRALFCRPKNQPATIRTTARRQNRWVDGN